MGLWHVWWEREEVFDSKTVMEFLKYARVVAKFVPKLEDDIKDGIFIKEATMYRKSVQRLFLKQLYLELENL